MSDIEKLLNQTQILREIFSDAIVNHEGVIHVHISNANAVAGYFDEMIAILVAEKFKSERDAPQRDMIL